ncbi:MAG TPA: 7-carboxy-7-deazaguanine synthase QueE [Streptosporangiaceae bacterium]
MAADSLVVSEIFGPTFQGEGPSTGRRCVFLRLAGCTLACSWCDTPYTWDWKGTNGVAFSPSREMREMTADEIWAELRLRGSGFLVVSGGEPMLQQARLVPLLRRAAADGWRIEMETAGVRSPDAGIADLVTQFNVSPKLSSSGNPLRRRINPVALRSLRSTRRAIWKFVAADSADLREVADVVASYDLAPVYIMPLGRTGDDVISIARALAPEVLDRGWNLTLRTHVILYGDMRGY